MHNVYELCKKKDQKIMNYTCKMHVVTFLSRQYFMLVYCQLLPRVFISIVVHMLYLVGFSFSNLTSLFNLI